MKHLDLLNDSPRKLFYKYLLPSISATLVTSIYILADSMMIGKGIGADGIAALNIVIPLFTLFFGIGLLFGVGGSVLMAVAQGSGDYEKGRRYFTTAFWSVFILACLITVLVSLNIDAIIRLMGATKVTHALAKEYGFYLTLGTPFFMFNSMLQAFIRNDRDPHTAMAGVIAGGVTNIVMDYVFIFILSMGMMGGAIATCLGSIVTVTILSTHFLKKSNNLKLMKGGFSFKLCTKIIGNGFSSFLIEMSNGIVTMVFNLQLVRYIGDLGVTVYSIIANSSFVVISLANGVSQAAQPILAINFGAGKKKRVTSVLRLGFLNSLVIASVITVLGFLFPGVITGMFVKATDEILVLAVPAIRMHITAFLFMFLNLFLSNYFQSVMKPYNAMGINLLRGLLLSCVFVMVFPLVFGAWAIWIVMPATEIITFIIAGILLSKAKKSGDTM